MPAARPVHCPDCQDLIGNYEPVVAVDPECIRITSLAREPEIAAADFDVLHRHCFLSREPAPNVRMTP
jgi:hypothetical protein